MIPFLEQTFKKQNDKEAGKPVEINPNNLEEIAKEIVNKLKEYDSIKADSSYKVAWEKEKVNDVVKILTKKR